MASEKSRPFQLSVLDQSPIAEGSTAGQALRNSVELARLADRSGYKRFWLAEHHGTPAFASASPEVVIGTVAAATEHIRVGSGGVMLPHYSPLKIAESFSMLSGMFPDRIDLGIGRAAGTSPGIAFALQRDRRQRSPDDFSEQMEELLGYFTTGAEKNPAATNVNVPGPFSQITRALPPFTSPRPFLLGSSPQSAVWAAEWGLPYVFADFINPDGAQIVEYYRRQFRPSSWLELPYVMVSSWVICAEDAEEAMRLSASSRMMLTLLHRGQLVPVPSVEKAQRFLTSEGLAADSLPIRRRMIVGSPRKVTESLEELALEYGGPDEIAMVNVLYDHRARLRSYQLVAEAFGMVESNRAHSEPVLV